MKVRIERRSKDPIVKEVEIDKSRITILDVHEPEDENGGAIITGLKDDTTGESIPFCGAIVSNDRPVIKNNSITIDMVTQFQRGVRPPSDGSVILKSYKNAKHDSLNQIEVTDAVLQWDDFEVRIPKMYMKESDQG